MQIPEAAYSWMKGYYAHAAELPVPQARTPVTHRPLEDQLSAHGGTAASPAFEAYSKLISNVYGTCATNCNDTILSVDLDVSPV
jgi:hypothetical protein